VVRFIVRHALIAIPFGLFFGLVIGGEPHHFVLATQAAFVIAPFVGLTLAASSRWIVPRIAPPESAPSGTRLVRVIAACTAASFAGVAAGAIVLQATFLPVFFGSSRQVLLWVAYAGLFTALFTSLGYARRYYGRYVEQVKNQERMKTQLADAELRALRAQVNPHFLFNTLNSIASLIGEDPAKAERMTEQLAEVFRHALQSSDRRVATLRDELRFLRAYLDIERTRMGDRLAVTEEIGPGAGDCDVPVLLLQPLVENAIRHASGTGPNGVRIVLRAHLRSGVLAMEVEDDGPGMAPDARERGGFGLRSVEERLRVLGDDHRLELKSVPTGGTIVRIDVPASSRERTP
jgi:sensor histidine kinase YesM